MKNGQSAALGPRHTRHFDSQYLDITIIGHFLAMGFYWPTKVSS